MKSRKNRLASAMLCAALLTLPACALAGETAPLTSYQFVRTGYFCRDGKYEGVTFNQVVSLKDGYKK